MAFITYLSLRELKADKKARINRDIRDKICDAYLKDLELIQLSTAVLMQGPTSFSRRAKYWPTGIIASTPYFPSWKDVRNEWPFLVKEMEKKKQVKSNVDKIEKFAKHCERFSNGVGIYKDDLFKVYEEEEAKEIPTLTSPPEWIKFTARTSAKPYSVSLLELIFLDKTFDQWLEEKTKVGIHLTDKRFQAGPMELDKKTFEKMYSLIKKRIEDSPELKKFVKENREIYKEAELLEKIIREIRNELEIY